MDGLITGREQQAEDLASLFHRRLVNSAREEGRFGVLRTRVSKLRSVWTQLATLLERPDIPILLFGESGTGKRRTIDEFASMSSFIRRLRGQQDGGMKVILPEFSPIKITGVLEAFEKTGVSVVYIERAEELSKEIQIELVEWIKEKKKEKRQESFHLVLGTEKALSFEILRGNFLRELYQLFEDGYLFLPSLQERATDLPFLLEEVLLEVSGKKLSPPAWLVDYFSLEMLENNLDQMHKTIKNLWAKNSDTQKWSAEDLGVTPKSDLFFKSMGVGQNGQDYLYERRRLQQSLLKNSGNRELAAKDMGINKSEFLRAMMRLGVR